MPRVLLLPFGFLVAAAITLAAPLLFALWAEVQPIDHMLHGTYYVVLPVIAWLWLILAPLLFGVAYLGGQRFAGLEFRRLLIWLNLVLWAVGAGSLLAPTLALSAVEVASATYTVGYSIDFGALDRILTLGYCVTLLSALVFAICFGEAVLKRLR
jgi:hypothetical protein